MLYRRGTVLHDQKTIEVLTRTLETDLEMKRLKRTGFKAKPSYWKDSFNEALARDKEEYTQELQLEKLKKQMARNQDRIHKFQKLKQKLEDDTYAKSGDKINQSLYLSNFIA